MLLPGQGLVPASLSHAAWQGCAPSTRVLPHGWAGQDRVGTDHRQCGLPLSLGKVPGRGTTGADGWCPAGFLGTRQTVPERPRHVASLCPPIPLALGMSLRTVLTGVAPSCTHVLICHPVSSGSSVCSNILRF